MTTHHHHSGHDEGDSGAPSGGTCGGHAPAADAVARADADDIAECPVMIGTTVIKSEAEDAGLYRDHDGQRYWLCCDACGPLFDADPGRYTAA